MAGQPSDSFHLQKTRRIFGQAISEFAKGSVIVSLIRDDADLSFSELSTTDFTVMVMPKGSGLRLQKCLLMLRTARLWLDSPE
jgi:hypothetical protein